MTDRIAVLRALQQRYDACHALCGDDMQMLLPCIDGLADELWPHLPALLDCAEALQGLVAYARDSQGIVGYHMNGAILEWDDVEELHAGINALARLNGESK